jgi:hypothetical protein
LREAYLNPPEMVVVTPEVVDIFPNRVLPKDSAAAAALKGRTMTGLYNEMPRWLVHAHRDVDVAVSAAYGWSADISNESALERLLDMNLSRQGE